MIKLNTEVTPNVREFHTVGILKKLGTEYRANKKGQQKTFPFKKLLENIELF